MWFSSNPCVITLRTSEIHLFYNLQLFYWHFLEILWIFIFLVFYFLFLFCMFTFTDKHRNTEKLVQENEVLPLVPAIFFQILLS